MLRNCLQCCLLFFILSACNVSDKKSRGFDEPEEFSQAHWGIRVEDLETGEVLIDHFGDKQFIPASVQKLVTTFTALQSLGPDYHFSTSVYAYAPINDDGLLNGDLILEGGRDPLFNRAALDLIVASLIERGLKTVKGNVVVDVSKYQGPRRMPNAEWEDLTWGYCPEISALTYEENKLSLVIRPAADASYPASVKMEQQVPYMSFLSGVGTGNAQEEIELYCERGIDDNTLEVKGMIPIDHPEVQVGIAIHDPAAYVREVFEEDLAENGVRVVGMPMRRDSKRYDLVKVESPSLIRIVEEINKESNNLAAELVYLEIPKEQRPRSADGSGLSRQNLASPTAICHLLRKGGEDWYATFPVAGVDGTLADRFCGTLAESNLRAKTGSMSGVNTLAGVAAARSGRKVCLCVFMNQFSQDLSAAREVLDQTVVEMLERL